MTYRRAASASSAPPSAPSFAGPSGRLALVLLVPIALLAGALGGCHHQVVVPFLDAGDPCIVGAQDHSIDCAEFSDTTCETSGAICPRVVYGCADAIYFSRDDYSECTVEGGDDDASLFGDVSLIGADASSGSDARDGATEDATAAEDAPGE
jgi:hypothetical protein